MSLAAWRSGNPADAPALAALHARCFAQGWDAVAFAGLLEKGAEAEMTVIDDELAGALVCRRALDEAEILTLMVHPSCRRQGIARGLIDNYLSKNRQMLSIFFLEVDAGNSAAIALYRGLGFEQAGVRKAYYAQSPYGAGDALLLRKALSPG